MIRMATMPATAATFLTAGILDHHLNRADQDQGCCPTCCGPCAALKALADTDQLDDLVREEALGHDWWDDHTGRVDRTWLTNAWRLTGCHQPPTATP